MSTVDSQWFANRIADLELSQRAIAKLMGLPPSVVNRLVKGSRRWQLEDVRAMAEILGVSATEIASRAGVDLPGESGAGVPVVGLAGADCSVGPLKAGIPRRAERPPQLPDGAKAIRMTKPGSPVDGWIFYFVPNTKLDPEAVGRLAVMELANNGGLKVGVLARGYNVRRWTVRALTDPQAELADVEISWASPVLWIKS